MGFHFTVGGEVLEHGLFEIDETDGALIGEDDGFGAEAVVDGVPGGGGLALRGFGAGGFTGVALIGLEFSIGHELGDPLPRVSGGYFAWAGYCGQVVDFTLVIFTG
ncbi:MAG: hypothetical protein NTY38_09695 [Acidobacteria bacterium]|nr:hypothetical protein [Acidobacteriota bacterium]